MSSRLRIALIEDEPSLVALYTVAMASLGDVETGSTKAEADELFSSYVTKQIKPDIILLDLIIPAMREAAVNFSERPGFEVLQWLRQQDWFRSVPIIVMTNLDSAEDRLKAEELGANDYLIKSNVVPREIIRRIRALL